jgi:AcrR family transcriptional regulator
MRTHRTRAEQVESNRAAVLAAARRIFLAKGYAGASVDAIAEDAGFSKGVVYSQFTSKADLFLALLEARIDARAAQNERLADDAQGAAGLLALIENFDRDLRAEVGWARLLIEFRAVALRDRKLNRRYAQTHARTIDLLADVLTGLHTRAGLEPTVPPRAMAAFIVAFGTGAALERAADPDALPPAVVAEMMCRALGFDTTDIKEVVR